MLFAWCTALCALLLVTNFASAGSESASPQQLRACLMLLCRMDSTTHGCTAAGPKRNHNGKYFRIERQTFAKCAYEGEGELWVMDKERAREMETYELEQHRERCERNFTCGSACIYNYYFTVWERCARTDVRTGRPFSECEKAAFAYFTQNGWCDEKQHIWEQVRRELPALERRQQSMGGRAANGGAESRESQSVEELSSEVRRETFDHSHDEEQETRVQSSEEAEAAWSGGNGEQQHQREHHQRGRQQSVELEEESREENISAPETSREQSAQRTRPVVVREFRLLDNVDELKALAAQMSLAYEIRRAENSFVFGTKSANNGNISLNGARLVIMDFESEIALIKHRPGATPTRSTLAKREGWTSLKHTLKGICMGFFH